ncbi:MULTISPECIES: hypothetical protein [Pontibacillus]|uniref:DUF3784 domain-containing protein n=1 Tax=Pontibacillus chungwhensis TaxID=265426 RepID=A0ABY8V1L4_9BACI|nr:MULTISPECIES: hypothetical protein [Pontibacillus]MCD5322234.1 hypothetical protein [Pontibacillus sp. HN14]WIF99528.1 hypothetical protein QNI29_07685 [Pontibacillus chungwhensis]
MVEGFISIVFMIPLYGCLLWSYYEPEESVLMGQRWMYKEEPEISEQSIRYTKFSSLAIMIGMPIIIFSLLTEFYILRFSMVILPVVLFVGWLKITADEEEY